MRTKNLPPLSSLPFTESDEADSEILEVGSIEEEPSEEELEQGALIPATSSSTMVPAELSQDLALQNEYDPLKQYLREIKKYPLLEPEEELALALSLQKEGNLEAGKRLVAANLRLVVKIAFEYCSYHSNLMDLIQEGNLGLMKAVSKFDPSKGARLSYYASWWIRSYILKSILDHFRLVKLGTTQAQRKLFYHLMREKEKLEAQGFSAQPKLLADRLKVREKDIIEMQTRLGLQENRAEVSLDAQSHFQSDRKTFFINLLEDPTINAEESLSLQQGLALLNRVLPHFEKTLNPKELKVLRNRLLADPPQTLQEIAEEVGMTRERIRQIEVRIVQKLRHHLEND